MKIFLTGFQRSGTTLLRDVMMKHPDVKHIFHEQGILRLSKSKLYSETHLLDSHLLTEKENGRLRKHYQLKIDFSLEKDTWGEKIPYYNMHIRKNDSNFSLFDYCDRWNDYFDENSRIIHIIRHPIDVALSTQTIGYAKSILPPLRTYIQNVPAVLKHFRLNLDNVFTIKYEDLITNPNTSLKSLYDFCGLNSSSTLVNHILLKEDFYWFSKINQSRAFNYKNNNKLDLRHILSMFPQLEDIINELNNKHGPKYEIIC